MSEIRRLVGVYGSLRKDEYNYNYFKKRFGDDYKYIKTTTIAGYKVYSLGSYPGMKPSDDESDKVIIDVIECSEECFRSIEIMEKGAGYVTVSVTDEKDPTQKYVAYIYEHSVSEKQLVKSGDWTKHLNYGQAIEVE